MNLQRAREYFDLGVIVGFEVVRDPVSVGGWMLVILGKSGDSWTFETAQRKPRSFASLDTVVTTIEQIAGRVTSMNVKP